MSRQRPTVAKLERERAKLEKNQAKQAKRQLMASMEDEPRSEPGEAGDQSAILEQLADLHRQFDDGVVSLDTFEKERESLTAKLMVD